MDWRPGPDPEPLEPWLRSGEHPTDGLPPLPDFDDQPTLIRPGRGNSGVTKLCRNPWCQTQIWRAAPDLCSECRVLFAQVAGLAHRVQTGKLTDFPMGANHIEALFRWKPLQRWEKTFRTVVVNACYHLRYWPWREPHFRGYDGPDAA